MQKEMQLIILEIIYYNGQIRKKFSKMKALIKDL